MKKQIVLIFAIGILFLAFQSFSPEGLSENAFPDEITTILKTSCYDCHYTGANAEKALKAVNFEEWEGFRVTRKIALLGEICKVVEEGKMPPQKYLEQKPDNKLTEEQKKLLCEWTGQELEKLIQGN
ncbi:MAG: heme-binding domain-containing protein [Bacteroidales bacterium]|nr:heme-binding domain-containing protein [Bacteroidales bacterium]